MADKIGQEVRTLSEVSRNRTAIMGILNVTPDSFSDGGEWGGISEAVARARQMVKEGADLVDVGGESSRPQAIAISEEEEVARVVPVIRELRHQLPEIVISIDTYKAKVARAALEAGADWINDIWGLKFGFDEKMLLDWSKAFENGENPKLPLSPMAALAAEKGCPIVLMHNRATPEYDNFWNEIIADLRVSLALAEVAGIAKEQIWLDPGFGFGKNPGHNLEVLKHLDRICALGYPVLLGTSRKSTIGLVLDRPVDERLEGTAATTVWGIAKGCKMVRVHDVAETVPFVKMADAIRKGIGFEMKSG